MPSSSNFDFGVAPLSDAGLRVGRDVGGGDIERRNVEVQSAGQRLVELRPVRSHRGMAIVAGHDGVDEIAAALGRRLRLRLRKSRGRHQSRKPQKTASHHYQSLLIVADRFRRATVASFA
jgi:hypothetical protein